jgi:hypothetical protein
MLDYIKNAKPAPNIKPEAKKKPVNREDRILEFLMSGDEPERDNAVKQVQDEVFEMNKNPLKDRIERKKQQQISLAKFDLIRDLEFDPEASPDQD